MGNRCAERGGVVYRGLVWFSEDDGRAGFEMEVRFTQFWTVLLSLHWDTLLLAAPGVGAL
jgi:hypothetical protein